MSSDLILRLRAILRSKTCTLRQVHEVSGIPISTLQDMKRDGWAARTLKHLDALEGALPSLEAEHMGGGR